MSVVRHQCSNTRRRSRVSMSMRTVAGWPISGPWVCLLILSVLALLPAYSLQASTLGQRDLSLLSSGQISSLVSFPDPARNVDPSNPNSHLSKILIPRVGTCGCMKLYCKLMNDSYETADTKNNTIVREYIITTLKALNWHIEEDTVIDNTPVGMKRFTNVIATKDPTASRRVILSAHFDSKYFSSYPQNQVRAVLLHV
jgi:glutaminyl-peptide cyclotransferase